MHFLQFPQTTGPEEFFCNVCRILCPPGLKKGPDLIHAACNVLPIVGVDGCSPGSNYVQHGQSRRDQVIEDPQFRPFKRNPFVVAGDDFRGHSYRVRMPRKHGCDRGGQIHDQECMSHVPKVNNADNASGIILCNKDIVGHKVIVNNLRP